MSASTFHSIWTLILFISFFGVVWWAYGKKRKARFEEDARMIFDEDFDHISKDHNSKLAEADKGVNK